MRVLVTGADGFVGSHVVSELLAQSHSVVAGGRGPAANGPLVPDDPDGSELPPRVPCDVTSAGEIERVFSDHRPTHVVHAAAITPDRRTETEESRRVLETNELGTLAVLLAAARHGVERFVYVGSSAVYAGAEPNALLAEEAPLCAECGLYALSKLAAERLCDWARGQFGVDTRIVRLGPVYGPLERPTASRKTMSTVHAAIRLALAGEPLRTPAAAAERRRDWIHGQDAARAMIALLAAPSPSHRIYNLSGAAVTTERLLAAVAAAVPGTRIEWVSDREQANVPVPGPDAAGRNLDCRRLRDDIGVRPPIGIEAGVRDEVARLAVPDGTHGTKEDA